MRSAFALTLALASAACSPSATCDTQQTYESPLLESEPLSGSFSLSAANEAQTLRFSATLSGLPELWSNSDRAVIGDLRLSLELRYDREPLGFDGRTEMPRLFVTDDAHAPSAGIEPNTSKFPGPAPLVFGSALFVDCQRGARQCESRVALRVQRLDGAPFPPLTVTWSAGGSAQLAACRALTRESQLTLEVEAP